MKQFVRLSILAALQDLHEHEGCLHSLNGLDIIRDFRARCYLIGEGLECGSFNTTPYLLDFLYELCV